MLKGVVIVVIFLSFFQMASAVQFIRGDSNGDGQVNIADPVFTLNYLFQNKEEPKCLDATDANDDGIVDISDAIKTLFVLFKGENMPAPFPLKGEDTTSDNLKCQDSCTLNKFKFAFILLGRTQADITSSNIDKLNKVKGDFATAFSQATNSLAIADVSFPVFTIVDDGTLMNTGKTEFDRRKVINKFFETHDDVFDFLVAFPAFVPSEGTSVNEDYTSTRYDTYGIGMDDVVRANFQFSKHLLGLAYIPRLTTVNEDINPYAVNGILHEIGHQWCCYVGDNFARGQNGAKLEIIQQDIHYYNGLQSSSDTGDPLGSNNWVANGDGTYRRENKVGNLRYNSFTLYFMGLLTKDDYDFSKKFPVYDAGIIGIDFNDQTARPYKQVSINDIIAVEGQRVCAE